MTKRLSERIAMTSLMAAISIICEFLPLDIPFPLMPRLTFDPTGIPLALLTLLYGLKEGTIATVITAFIISMPRPPFRGPNPFGGLMKGIAELSTIAGIPLSKSLFRRHRRLFLPSLLLVCSTMRVLSMSVANYLLLPLFLKLPVNIVVSLMIPIAIFNLIQALINITVAISLQYKVLYFIQRR